MELQTKPEKSASVQGWDRNDCRCRQNARVQKLTVIFLDLESLG